MAGVDAPRPLSMELRQRLEQALVGADGAGHRPLDPDLAERLQGALADPLAGALDGVDAPRPLDPELRGRLEKALQPRPHRSRLVLAAAAVLAVLAGAGLAAGLSGSNTAAPQRALTHRSGGSQNSAGTGGSAASSGGTTSNAPAQNVRPATELPNSLGATAAPSPPRPSVSGVTPDTGPAAGGTWVTISGSGLSGVRSVSFGEVPAAQFVRVSDAVLQALAPAHGAGTVDVLVTAQSGSSAPSPADHYPFG